MVKEIRTVKITEKGQIVIPKMIRMLEGFKEGSKISVIAYDNRIELRPINQITEGLSRALLSESVLAKDWNTPEEDEAWKDL